MEPKPVTDKCNKSEFFVYREDVHRSPLVEEVRGPSLRFRKRATVDLIDGVKPVRSKIFLSIDALIKIRFIVFAIVHIKGSR